MRTKEDVRKAYWRGYNRAKKEYERCGYDSGYKDAKFLLLSGNQINGKGLKRKN